MREILTQALDGESVKLFDPSHISSRTEDRGIACICSLASPLITFSAISRSPGARDPRQRVQAIESVGAESCFAVNDRQESGNRMLEMQTRKARETRRDFHSLCVSVKDTRDPRPRRRDCVNVSVSRKIDCKTLFPCMPASASAPDITDR